jgi:hypothetical protein
MHKSPPSPPSRLSRAAIAATWLLAAGAAIVILLVAASSAEGGTYRAAQCNPNLGAGHADVAFERNSDHYVSRADCDGGGGLVVRHAAENSRRDRWGAWGLAPPEGAEIVSFAAKVAGTAAAGHVPSVTVAVHGELPESFGRAAGSVHTVRWQGSGADGFAARLECTRSRCGEGATARVMIRRIGLRISDSRRPEATLDGPLAGGRTVRGTQALDTIATDRGAGVRKLYLEVNGKPIGTRRIPCELQGRVALRLRPCPLDVERRWDLDTTGRGFRQGLNRIRLCADDLAFGGMRNRECARHKARVDNECPVDRGTETGVLHARLAGVGRRGSVPYDRSARVIGTLTDSSGRGIAGAEVCVATRVWLGDRAERVVATPETGANGGFEVRLDAGPTREVRVAHWSADGEVAERYLRLRVRARPVLDISPGSLRNGETARFRVRLHGPDPGRRRVQLEVRDDGGWKILRAHNSAPSGTWRDSYRFTSTTGTRTYRFRAVVPKQSGYPYERGASEVETVRVRG